MGTASRLVCIGFVAPAITHGIAIIAWGPVLLVMAVIGYPVMVVTTFALLIPLHWLFRRYRLSPLTQLPVVLPASLVGGLTAQFMLFHPEVLFGSNLVIDRVALEYALLGGLAGICCWGLYNWGPLRVSAARSNPSLQSDRPQAAGR